ncbi:PPK2 family polyphosphate kinase [Deinococcus radiophilus]|uniref:Polyphosphate kinase 2 family protein n=1 Tax=Deinococcus radiophilus TaxID=32062 RepID=A0A431VJ41_9DEIO|nr:PPK2 family polyphosphate kinase [Deinococcus radiophilus]RTR21152.1 polyphosphate kinase 2 family protein [Deinococcus radiophilus]UFA50225.1 polyphosphate kinase 2 family protein [Deinococcus radiophilus]
MTSNNQALEINALKQIQVPSGKKVKLSDYPTDDFQLDGHRLDKEKTQEAHTALEEQLADWQEKLYAEGKQSLLIVLQARDAGGKDSTVGRVMDAFDPNGVNVVNFKQPTEPELAHDFLWRVHQQTPRRGMIAVFNRSHYEDVLVTRVHGLIDAQKTEQNLQHIVNFEQLLADSGTKIVKIYLHLSPAEQKERLLDRLNDPSKHWKFNPGDLKDRELWHEYTAAYEDAMTSSRDHAPWHVVPADHKWLRDHLISLILLRAFEEMNPSFPKAAFKASHYEIPEV